MVKKRFPFLTQLSGCNCKFRNEIHCTEWKCLHKMQIINIRNDLNHIVAVKENYIEYSYEISLHMGNIIFLPVYISK